MSHLDNMPPEGRECVVDAKGEKLLQEPGKTNKACSNPEALEKDSLPLKESGKME